MSSTRARLSADIDGAGAAEPFDVDAVPAPGGARGGMPAGLAAVVLAPCSPQAQARGAEVPAGPSPAGVIALGKSAEGPAARAVLTDVAPIVPAGATVALGCDMWRAAGRAPHAPRLAGGEPYG